jgi:hypothetical protein
VPLVQAANDLGVTDEIPIAAGFVDNVVMPAFFADAIGTTSGILYHYTLADNEINDWLVEQTTARFSVPPDLFDADAMNAAILIGEALKATGGDATASVLIGVCPSRYVHRDPAECGRSGVQILRICRNKPAGGTLPLARCSTRSMW